LSKVIRQNNIVVGLSFIRMWYVITSFLITSRLYVSIT